MKSSWPPKPDSAMPDRSSSAKTLCSHAPEKIVSDLAVWMERSRRPRVGPSALAEAMVDRDLTVYRVENAATHKVTYLSERELADKPGKWKKLGTVEGSGRGAFWK